MVDFTNDTLMSRPPSDIVAIILLEKYNNYIEAVEVYISKEDKGFTHSVLSTLKSRLYAMFIAQKPALKRALKPEDFKLLESIPEFEEFEEISEAYDVIISWLDKIKLLRLDTLKERDITDILGENAYAGYD